MLALEKQKLLIEKFREWVWKEPSRKERLHRIYEEKFCSTSIRHYDGSFLSFPQMSPDEELYDYQKNAYQYGQQKSSQFSPKFKVKNKTE